MICPHCGKEIDNTITINMPANINNGCNPIIPTFQTFDWNINAAAGNPVSFPYTTTLNLNSGAANNGGQFVLAFDAATGKWTQGEV